MGQVMAGLPNYGIDAPSAVRNNALIGLAAWVLGAAIFAIYRHSDSDLAWSALIQAGIMGAVLQTVSVFMLWSSKVGKFRVRDRLLHGLAWHGDEQVLDIGCGRGLVLLGAAARLTSGRATGVDLWSATDLSGNTEAAVMANARAEDVADKVVIETADARDLPFADDVFDLVLSMTAIHNIKDGAGRKRALQEAARVLRPGGRLAIFDIFRVGKYQQWLMEYGLQEVKLSGIYLLWFVPGRIVTARKPERREPAARA
jgi:SAM-dependent methyltransferase